MTKQIKLTIVLSSALLFLYSSLFYLYAQEEQTKQRYQQGKEFYSQGRYQEAASEFEKTIESLSPLRTQFIEKTLKELEKAQREQERQAQLKARQEEQARLEAEREAKKAELKAQREEQRRLEAEKRAQEKQKAEEARVQKIAAEKEKREQAQRAKEEEQARLKAEQERQRQEKETQLKLEKERLAKVPVLKPPLEREEKEYYIDIGDVLDISLWQMPDLSKSEVIVRPDGKISFPLIGDIKTEGLTLTESDIIMTEKLKAYVKAPEVSIMIRRFGEETNKVVILGEILSPGVYKFSGPPTITEVVASAGGYTKYAVLNSIMVISGDVRTKPEVVEVNLAQILKSGRLSENIFLKPNDIVYVPRSFIGNVNTFLEIFQPAINQYLQTLNARQLHNIVRKQ
jgi:polysaccharide export outer membrane protein